MRLLYLSYKLSYRDLVTMIGEQGIGLVHTTILRWVTALHSGVEKRWRRYALGCAAAGESAAWIKAASLPER